MDKKKRLKEIEREKKGPPKPKVVARTWRLEDTGRTIVVSGDPGIRSNPNTADVAVQVRP